VLGQVRQAPARLGQLAGGFGLGALGLEKAQRALQHHGQSAQLVLVNVIADPSNHGIGDRSLADGARHQDKGQLKAAALQDVPGVHPRKTTQVVIGQNRIPSLGRQLALEILQRIHLDQRAIQVAAAQDKVDQLVIARVIL